MEIRFSTKFTLIIIGIIVLAIYIAIRRIDRFGTISNNTLAFGAGYMPYEGSVYEGSPSHIGDRISMSSVIPGFVSPHGLSGTHIYARFNQVGELTDVSPNSGGLTDAGCHKIRCPGSFDGDIRCLGCNQ